MRAEPVAGWPHECVVARCRVSERQTRVRSVLSERQTRVRSVPAAGGSGPSPNYPTPNATINLFLLNTPAPLVGAVNYPG